jgi:hypothetical protein
VEAPQTLHETCERRRREAVFQIDRWRVKSTRLYEKRVGEEASTVVRAAVGESGFEIAGNDVRRLRRAEIKQWRREVLMTPADFEAHAGEMGVTRTVEGGVERLEAPQERLVLERDARSGVPRRMTDLRAKKSIVFEQPKDVQGRHWPRLEIHYSLDRELWRDRIITVEFDQPVPAEVTRLWDALAKGSGSVH